MTEWMVKITLVKTTNTLVFFILHLSGFQIHRSSFQLAFINIYNTHLLCFSGSFLLVEWCGYWMVLGWTIIVYIIEDICSEESFINENYRQSSFVVYIILPFSSIDTKRLLATLVNGIIISYLNNLTLQIIS